MRTAILAILLTVTAGPAALAQALQGAPATSVGVRPNLPTTQVPIPPGVPGRVQPFARPGQVSLPNRGVVNPNTPLPTTSLPLNPSTQLGPGGQPPPSTGLAITSPTQPQVRPFGAESFGTIGAPAIGPSELTPPLTPDAVGRAQAALAGAGLYRGPITGTLTGPTRVALRSFQQSVNLPQTGELDLRTAGALGLRDVAAGAASPPNQQVAVAGNPAVLSAQQQLVSLGLLSPSGVTGTLDLATRAALAQFQTSVGFAATGELDEITVQALANGSSVPVFIQP